MLTIRNFLFSLSLSPLLALAWQLPNQAQNTSGTAGTNSGASTGVSETSTVSNPPVISTPTGQTITSIIVPGVSFGITTGVSTTGELSAISTTIPVSTATVASTSSSVTVTNSATGNSVVITLPPQVQVAVNQSAAAIIQTLSTTGGGGANVVSLLTGGAGSQAAAVALTDSLTTAGISPQKAQALVAALDGLFGSTKASLSNLPIAQATSGQLVASNKALKPILVIAQFGAAINVDINKLNDAIVAYNGIILTSEAENLRKLYKDTDFVGIAKVLQELRTSIQ
ncbi:hypothetical protein [Dolichospermum flos-aquae]|uniref:Uncharacterized protein n=1 Tax=Dolichospermum flos-aquae CCAP 1403/13F TaxID=315271 RepID=A0A6H2BVV9_DOLFA|nr:hypothetical protein [Dolichospermum flos-aquae]QJB43715.1 hypothetical protein HGD76_05260 [Dolichospermum flos-aquae CCAP 1403/13F]